MKPPDGDGDDQEQGGTDEQPAAAEHGAGGLRTGFLAGLRADFPLPEAFGREPFVPELPCLPILLG